VKDCTLALVQMASVPGDVHANGRRIDTYVQQAEERNVDIICFPEAALTGYSAEHATRYAWDIDTAAAFLHTLSDRHKMTILCGLIECSAAGAPYITHIVSQPGQPECQAYRKTHLGMREKAFFRAGSDLPVFTTPCATIGIQICYELHFPEITTTLALAGAEIVFAPHASPVLPERRRDLWKTSVPARAQDNTVYVAACNSAGGRFHGGALVCDPKGNIIAEDFSGKDGVLVTRLEASRVTAPRGTDNREMRNRFYLRERRPELYGSLTLSNTESSGQRCNPPDTQSTP
jgi:predicted amidohydrolase